MRKKGNRFSCHKRVYKEKVNLKYIINIGPKACFSLKQ